MIELQLVNLIPYFLTCQVTIRAKELVVRQLPPTAMYSVTIVVIRAVIPAEAGDKQWNIMKVM